MRKKFDNIPGPKKDVLKKFGDKEDLKYLHKIKNSSLSNLNNSQDITNIFKKTKTKKIILKSILVAVEKDPGLFLKVRIMRILIML